MLEVAWDSMRNWQSLRRLLASDSLGGLTPLALDSLPPLRLLVLPHQVISGTFTSIKKSYSALPWKQRKKKRKSG
jgi:hypothetical protein